MNGNGFYNPFDFDKMEPFAPKENEVRTPFQIDRDRIIFSYAFRRLQSKTQVFQAGEFDFYRTRLTHSLEVGKISRSIAEFLNKTSPHLSEDFYIDSDLVEAVGLAHDLGHPPFGHIGERKLNELMKPYGGFEGNAQTLRILTSLFFDKRDGTAGMNASRAVIDGILKYKATHSQLISTDQAGTTHYPKNHFIYDNDHKWIDFALGERVKEIEDHLKLSGLSVNDFKSLECQVMDWADDTAYSINDIIDSVQAGYLTAEKIRLWAEYQDLNEHQVRAIDDLQTSILSARYESFLNKRIGDFIRGVSLHEQKNPLSKISNRHKFGISIDAAALAQAKIYKKLAVDLIFKSPQIQRIEYKGGWILERLFNAIFENYLKSRSDTLKLIPKRYSRALDEAENEPEKARVLCDFISEMTDGMALRTYRQLFDPDYGSILDIV